LLTARDSFAQRPTGSGAFTVEVEDQEFACSTAALGGGAADASRSLSLTLAGGDGGGWTQQLQADVAFHGDEICVWVNGEHAAVPAIVHAPRGSDEAAAGGGSGGGNIVAPMPGKVVRVLVNAGDEVEEDQPLIGAGRERNALCRQFHGIVFKYCSDLPRQVRDTHLEEAHFKMAGFFAVIEAMKMEHTLRAAGPGVVGEVMCVADELVDDSKVLVKIAAE
jgi:biotin carboxyl carrier protein